jgi:hypothetical protein
MSGLGKSFLWAALVGGDAGCLVALLVGWVSGSPWLFAAIHVGLAIASGFATALVVSIRPASAMFRMALLVGAFACFVPVIGPVGLLVLLAVTGGPRRADEAIEWMALASPDPRDDASVAPAIALPGKSAGFSTASAILRDRRPESIDLRLQCLLRSSGAPPRDVVALLKLALTDPADEIRLFAFSRLERWRNELEQNVKVLQSVATSHAGAGPHLRLAEVYWELAYFGLVEGAVRDHALSAALASVDRACAVAPEAARSWFLRGRILMQLADYDQAGTSFERALRLDHPAVKVLPYLAECAFRQKDFGRVRSTLRSFDARAAGHVALRPVVEFWR